LERPKITLNQENSFKTFTTTN
jgi:hypothetical protein